MLCISYGLCFKLTEEWAGLRPLYGQWNEGGGDECCQHVQGVVSLG